MGKICINQEYCMDTTLFMILLLILLSLNGYFIYRHITSYIAPVEKKLYKEISLERPINTRKLFLDKIYDPLAPPENLYNSDYDSYNNFQMLGYISGNGNVYPIIGRQRYRNRTDKMEYHTIDSSRNQIKIPIATHNYDEVYTGDTMTVPELGGEFIFTKYENMNNRY